MKKILGTLLAVLFSFMAINDSAAQNTVLRFNKDGKFKIVQFTDVHFKYGNPASDVALERIGEVLDVGTFRSLLLLGIMIMNRERPVPNFMI